MILNIIAVLTKSAGSIFDMHRLVKIPGRKKSPSCVDHENAFFLNTFHKKKTMLGRKNNFPAFIKREKFTKLRGLCIQGVKKSPSCAGGVLPYG